MITRMKCVVSGFAAIFLFFGFLTCFLYAQDPGDACDPDASRGHTARLISFSGAVKIVDADGRELHASDQGVIPHGGKVVAEAGAKAVCALEDGTKARSSRIHIGSGSQVIFTGGLFCSDLRPKADGGRWSVREAGIEMISGSAVIEIAEGVSHSFNFEISTPNVAARMIRGTQDKMSLSVNTGSLGNIPLIPIIEHPGIKGHIAGLLMGRDMDALSVRERESVMAQAAMAGFSMGLIDMEKSGLLENPQISSTVNMMTRGRNFSDIDENERSMILQAVAGMAVQQGLVDVNELKVPAHPDEQTVIEVHTGGRMRVHNKHRGWKRAEAVEVRPGMAAEVKGRDVPVFTAGN